MLQRCSSRGCDVGAHSNAGSPLPLRTYRRSRLLPILCCGSPPTHRVKAAGDRVSAILLPVFILARPGTRPRTCSSLPGMLDPAQVACSNPCVPSPGTPIVRSVQGALRRRKLAPRAMPPVANRARVIAHGEPPSHPGPSNLTNGGYLK
jgi:hypothetical protein